MDENIKDKAPKRQLTKLEKRYKGLRWGQNILFWLSVISAIVPAGIAIIKVGMIYKEAEAGKWSLAGFSIFIAAVGFLLIFKGLKDKFRDRMPWATTATIGTWIMFAFIVVIRGIIEDAYVISFVLAIGCSVAGVLSAISDHCKAHADAIKDEYYRRSE